MRGLRPRTTTQRESSIAALRPLYRLCVICMQPRCCRDEGFSFGFAGELRHASHVDSLDHGDRCAGTHSRGRSGASRICGIGGGVGSAGIRTCRRRRRRAGRLYGGPFNRSLVGPQAIGAASGEIAGSANHAAGIQGTSRHAGRAPTKRIRAGGRDASIADRSARGAIGWRPQRHAARSNVGMMRQG
jgi:hypothetical protein